MFVSSAYCINFNVSACLGNLIPSIRLFCLILLANVSAIIQKCGREIGQPCKIPLFIFILSVKNPLFITIDVLSL